MRHRVAVIGMGYVGTVAAACLAYIGHQVIGVESGNVKLRQCEIKRASFWSRTVL